MLLIQFVAALVIVGVVAWLMNDYMPMNRRFRGIVNVVLTLIVVGMVLWLINTYIPMAGSIRAILNIVVVIATIVGVLQALGLWQSTLRLWRNMIRHRPHVQRPPEPHQQQ